MTGVAGGSGAIQSGPQPESGGMKQPAVYIMASRRNGTIYTGVTSNLVQRAWQHRNLRKGFAGKHGCAMLVWYELHDDMRGAITREKQLKGGSRKRKLVLIDAMNPEWKDLFESIC
jgi:putative endonuclease